HDWYAKRSPSAAAAFLASLDDAVNVIRSNPGRWPEQSHGTKRYLLRRFPYAVIYRITDATIQVIAVAHGRRRPAYWRKRKL
ncbi:MAG TPA: type II toxin-antitoxin system RelE/ParE family toxin, partial [Candidatus Binatus sp.]|nr:type II toxin-antitoxin system RelE/ParE family toxin [Candidatus Binatus sp.]